LQNPAQDIEAISKGKTGKVVEDSLVAAPNRIISGANPVVGLAAAAAFGKRFFPDPIRKPSTIKDFGEYLAQTMGVAPLYRAASGSPKGGNLADEAINLVGYQFDPGESSYYEAKKMVSDYNEGLGKSRKGVEGQTLMQWIKGDPAGKKSIALSRFRMAIARGDEETAARWIGEYYANGGTLAGYKISAASSQPVAIKKDKAAFMASLDDQEKEVIDRAQRWHDKVWGKNNETANRVALKKWATKGADK
jgi:hypothetical protein